VSIDYHESQAGDPAAYGRPAIPAWDRVAGRAAPGVVRVTARLGPDAVTVPVVNGTYLANIVRGLHDWAIIPGQRKLTRDRVRRRRAGARPDDLRRRLEREVVPPAARQALPEAGALALSPVRAAAPDGTVVVPARIERGHAQQKCGPAVRWR